MKRALALVFACLVLGTLAGFVLGRRTAPAVALTRPGASSIGDVAAAPPAAEGTPSKPALVAAPCVTTAQATTAALSASTPVDATLLAAENTLLRLEFARLKANAAATETQRVLEEGVPLQPPPGLDARFGADALREGVTRALKEAGFEQAEITSIDCTEHPCIVYGEGIGGREDFEKLRGTAALRAYAGDSNSGSGWAVGRNPDGSAKYRYFGLALYAADERKERGEAFGKRIEYRTRLMAETFPSD